MTRKKQGTSIAYFVAQALSMVPSQCLFCDQVNPTGAKFCNNCGAPLQVKLCSRCEAVNDQTAKSCHKCGTEFPAPAITAGAPPTSSAPNVTAASPAVGEPLPFRLDFDLRELPNPLPSAQIVTAAAHASFASEPALATANSPAPQLARPVAAVALDKVDLAIDRQHSTFDHSIPSAFVGPERGHTPERESAVPLHNPEATTERHPSSRAVRAVALSIAAFTAIGILAYYVYGPSMLPAQREGAQVSSTPADVNAGGPLTAPRPVGETASSGPSASVGTDSAAVVGAAIPAPSAEPSTAATGAPAGQGTAAATGSTGVASQTPSPNEPRLQLSTSDRVSAPEDAAARANEVVKKPSAATANAGKVRDGAPATSNEVTTKYSAPNRPMRTYQDATSSDPVQLPLGDDRAKARLDASRPRPCTEGVAALGLCSMNSGGERK